ncbi:MAG: hypothetical protein Q4G03_08195 [Planctomycetia bacterium]|nr:hypothetical protein [Planctomycetia bacterium]
MSDLTLFALLPFPQIWLAIPLVLAFSLTYAGTRAEEPKVIIKRALRVLAWLLIFLILVAIALRWLV